MDFKAKGKDTYGATVKRQRGLSGRARIRGRWEVRCLRPDGSLKWRDEIRNLVVNAGLDHLLDATLSAGTQITTWYVGLTASSPTPAAGDTMSSHGGWTENQNYDEAVRQTWSDGGVSSQSVDNSGNTADFTMSSDSDTVGGAFLASDNTKGGTTGTLYAVGAFSGGDKSVDDGNTLQVTATFTMADDGA